MYIFVPNIIKDANIFINDIIATQLNIFEIFRFSNFEELLFIFKMKSLIYFLQRYHSFLEHYMINKLGSYNNETCRIFTVLRARTISYS